MDLFAVWYRVFNVQTGKVTASAITVAPAELTTVSRDINSATKLIL